MHTQRRKGDMGKTEVRMAGRGIKLKTNTCAQCKSIQLESAPKLTKMKNVSLEQIID